MESRTQRMVALAALAVTAALLQLPLWGWEVEDAAIDLAYARNVADGYGLVAQVGGERIEGFSNPLWVAILGLGSAIGIDGFTATRLLGLAFGVAAVPAVYAAMRPVAQRLPGAPLAAAAAIALYAPHAIWAQSGLENALFSLLLAVGCARVAVEDDFDALGPLAFAGVALTRPEGVMYGIVGCGAALASAESWTSAARRLAMWITLFGVPVAGSELARVVYFGQELPATFHAKLGSSGMRLDGGGRGWKQLFAFGRETGTVALLPLMVVGASGSLDLWWVSGIVGAVVLGIAAWTGAGWIVLLGLLALPLLALGRKAPIVLAAALVCVGCTFHVGADGDWMRGYRWMSMVAVPGAMLVGAGTAELAKRFDDLRFILAATLGIALLPQVVYVAKYAADPEVSPAAVVERLDHWLSVGRRLQIDRRLQIVDHDMGGNLYFGADRAWFRDTKGLVDLPFALYGPEPSVVRHELFDGGARFDFAHAHGNTLAAIGGLSEFRQQFVEIEGYGPRRAHGGQFVRRTLFLEAEWSGPQLPIGFGGGVRLHGVSVPSPEVGPGGGLYLEVGVDRQDRTPFRVAAFLVPSGGGPVAAAWDLPPAYDWVDVKTWRPGEVFHGRFSLPLPKDLVEGRYDLGLVVFDGSGGVLAATSATAPAVLPAIPAFATGEVRIPRIVTIVSREEMGRLALADKSDALTAAAAGKCEDAERAWELALRHRTRSGDWRRANRPPVARALAKCWAERAASRTLEGDELLDRVRELETARSWDPTEPATWEHGKRVGAVAHGRAIETDDVTLRFQWAEAAVRADPTRSWDRRLAERTRRTWVSRR